MESELKDLINDAWTTRAHLLKQRLDDVLVGLDKMLALDEHYRFGNTDEKRLEKSLGSFGAHQIDASAMASVLERGSEKRAMAEDRVERIRGVHEKLKAFRERLNSDPLKPTVISVEEDVEQIIQHFEKESNEIAQVFGWMRIANLERRAAYVPEEHDEYFAQFDWYCLDNSEAELCPPFGVIASPGQNYEEFFSKLLPLVASGRAIKVFMIRARVRGFSGKTAMKGRAAALKCSIDIELMPFLLRKVYLLQSCPRSNPKFGEALAEGLFSPRPAIFSLFCPYLTAKTDNDAEVLSEEALLSRTFPQFCYNPDRTARFVTNLELIGNPEEEARWAMSKLTYHSESGAKEQVERPFTFADFALGQEEFEGCFSEVPAGTKPDELVLVSDYLEMTSAQRTGKTPYIYAVDERQHLTKLVPSQEILSLTAEKMHLWQTLQSLAGIGNPYVQAAMRKAEEELLAEKETSLQALRTEMEGKYRERETQAVRDAMKNLAMRLSGVEVKAAPAAVKPNGHAKKAEAPAAPAPEAPKAEPEPAAQPKSEAQLMAWIETEDCISCDECISKNSKIFAYNDDNKAYIKDASAGPFKHIVQAAEACPAGVIHPGTPLDPDEKGVEKWTEIAAQYN